MIRATKFGGMKFLGWNVEKLFAHRNESNDPMNDQIGCRNSCVDFFFFFIHAHEYLRIGVVYVEKVMNANISAPMSSL